MSIEEYVSFRYADEEPVGELRYVTKHGREYYEGNIEALRIELWSHYYSGFFAEEKLSKKFRFLDFHLQLYEGDKRDFTYFVKQSPYGIPDDVLDIYFRLHLQDRLVEMVSEWLAELDEGCSKRSLGTTSQQGPEVPTKAVTPKVYPPSPDEDRIHVYKNKIHVDGPVIRGWFKTELLDRRFNGNGIISIEDFDTFLYAGFAAFEKKAVVAADNKLVVNADGAFLKNVMYRFYKEYRQTSKDKALREGLAVMLKNTFKLFEDQEVITISGSMHRHYSAK